MVVPVQRRDAHERPPETLKARFKHWQKSSAADIDGNAAIVGSLVCDADEHLNNCERAADTFGVDPVTAESARRMACEIEECPGLIVFPGLLSPALQVGLLDRLLHRDLSNPQHLTNVHLFHHMQYPDHAVSSTLNQGSFFGMERATQLLPKDATVHKPMSIEQCLRRKLRWITLGGQYDWTHKVYPDEVPPEFPKDIAQLLKAFFPEVDAQAAIVNLYTPGDILAVHRDVSEECDRGLISVSIGCDALFLVGNEDGTSHATIRLRSGDAVLMSGASRYAWHGVPKILPGTCPEYLREWPHAYPDWKGWMTSKRINLNVRQMKA